MITSFKASNFRCHRSTLVEFGRWTILYGGNGTGKSALLDALNLSSSFIDGTDARHLFPIGVFSLSAQMHDSTVGPLTFEISHRVGDGAHGPHEILKYAVAFGSTMNSVTVLSETLDVDEENVLSSTSGTKTRLSGPSCSDRDAANELVGRHRFARRYRMEPRAIREVSASHHYIERNGAGLASAVHFLKVDHPSSYTSLVSDFTHLFPEVSDVRPVQTGSGDMALEFDTIGAAQMSGVNLSDGQALSLGILFLAHAPQGPRLLLLDEPEVTLSPVVVKRLLECVDRALAPDRQVVTTTHSPYVMQWGIHNGAEVRQVRPDFGSRTWRESLRSQAIEADTYHTHMDPIDVTRCCALLETYLTG